MHWSRSSLLTAMIIACAGSSAHAQRSDSTADYLRDAPLAGSARVALTGAYRAVHGAWEASLGGTVAPFVGEHWQLGTQPAFNVIRDREYAYSGGLGVLANYLFLNGNVSRPYVGVYLADDGGTGAPSTTVVGVQAGWLRFLTPSIALRTELDYRHYRSEFEEASNTSLTMTLDPYLFGRANERLTAPPGLGVVDVNGIVQLLFHPSVIFLQGTVAPYLATWFQPGLSIAYANPGSGSANVEFFGRGYLPVTTRFAPFADLFGTANENSNSHGARAGLRSYLTRGVALDVDWEWRNFDRSGSFTLAEQRTLRASLMTQFGSRRD